MTVGSIIALLLMLTVPLLIGGCVIGLLLALSRKSGVGSSPRMDVFSFASAPCSCCRHTPTFSVV